MGIRDIESRPALRAVSTGCAAAVAAYGAGLLLHAALPWDTDTLSALFGLVDRVPLAAAIGYFAAGTGGLLLQRAGYAPPIASGAAVILAGLIILLADQSGTIQPSSELARQDLAPPGRAMAAICLFIAGSALLSRGIDRYFGESITTLTVILQGLLAGAGVIAISAVFADPPGPTVWGRVIHLPIQQAASMTILALALMIDTAASWEDRPGRPHWLPITVFIVAVAATLAIWHVLANPAVTGTHDHSRDALLVFGLIMAASLAAAITAAQRARNAAAEALAYADRFRHAERIADLFHWTTGPRIESWEYVSDFAASFYGISPDAFVTDKSRFTAIIHPADRTRVLTHYEALNANPAAYVLEYRFIHPEYGIRFCREVGEPIFDARGNLLHFRGTTQDITEKRATEAQLMEAKADAENANRAKSVFLAHMSHELRTPLNSIIGFSQIIANQVFGKIENPKYEDYIGVIERSAQHLLALINDVLDLTKVEAGKTELKECELDLADLSRDAVELVFGTATSRRITYRLSPQTASRRFRGDRRLIMQCLTNLLGNARKFTPADGTVTVGLDMSPDAGFRLDVTDTGIGIAADKLEQVMEPFNQVRPDVAHSTEGTGLGLTIVKRLVELHGGKVTIDSSLGDGTTVTLFFPPDRTIPADGPELRAATA